MSASVVIKVLFFSILLNAQHAAAIWLGAKLADPVQIVFYVQLDTIILEQLETVRVQCVNLSANPVLPILIAPVVQLDIG